MGPLPPRWPRTSRFWLPCIPGLPVPAAGMVHRDRRYRAELYLRLLEQRDLRDVLVIGSSIGGWIASEMAVREHERISGTALLNAVGINVARHRACRLLLALHPKKLIEVFVPRSRGRPRPGAASPGGTRHPGRERLNARRIRPRACRPHDPKLRRRLALVPTPVVAIWVLRDQIAPGGLRTRLRRVIPERPVPADPAGRTSSRTSSSPNRSSRRCTSSRNETNRSATT